MALTFGSKTGLGSSGLTAIRDELYTKAVAAGWTGHDAANKVIRHGTDSFYIKFADPVSDDDSFATDAIAKQAGTGTARWHIPVIVGSGYTAPDITGSGQGYYCSVVKGTLADSDAVICYYAMDADVIAFYTWGDPVITGWQRAFFMAWALEALSPFPLADTPFFALGHTGSNTSANHIKHIRNPSLYDRPHILRKSYGYDTNQGKYYIDPDPVFLSRAGGTSRRVLGHLSPASQAVVRFLGPVPEDTATNYTYFEAGIIDAYSVLFELTIATLKFLSAKVHPGDNSSNTGFYTNAPRVPLVAIRSS
jgi:hypothetical protein